MPCDDPENSILDGKNVYTMVPPSAANQNESNITQIEREFVSCDLVGCQYSLPWDTINYIIIFFIIVI